MIARKRIRGKNLLSVWFFLLPGICWKEWKSIPRCSIGEYICLLFPLFMWPFFTSCKVNNPYIRRIWDIICPCKIHQKTLNQITTSLSRFLLLVVKNHDAQNAEWQIDMKQCADRNRKLLLDLLDRNFGPWNQSLNCIFSTKYAIPRKFKIILPLAESGYIQRILDTPVI